MVYIGCLYVSCRNQNQSVTLPLMVDAFIKCCRTGGGYAVVGAFVCNGHA
ncbi:Uncharacterised protein [Segatella copri]|nr:Uncharacterised protein [Segatella copri]